MPAADYSAALSGLTVNLLVIDVASALRFQTEVLGVRVLYSDPDFAALEHEGTAWCLHADHAYDDHPLRGIAGGAHGRVGIVKLGGGHALEYACVDTFGG